ncbi:MAG TPA: antibiotic biosynthesis monooxygenase family protein [Chloroflexota bacterium]
MHEVSIRQRSGVMTLINVFTVDPERLQELMDLLTEVADNLMRKQPGFVSASLHRSADGRRIVNYAQWHTPEDFEAVRNNPDLQPHFARVAALAHIDPIVCDVAHVFAA